jgi:hypothetical protein
MNPAGTNRVALALPVGSTRRIVAAAQVVVYLVEHVGKTELDLFRLAPDSAAAPEPGERRAILFVAVAVRRAPLDPTASARFERDLRTRVERAYARQGITPVEYDLQML